MDLKEIRQLVKLVESSGISELEIEEKDKKIKISKNNNSTATVQQVMPAMPQAATPAPAPTAIPEATPATQAAEPAKSDKIVEIKSPMVGTFYRSPSPDSDPYVDVGKSVKAGDVLCIVEAMKLMNEIECEVKGTIVEILVDNAQPVEYNQALFLVEKA